jgi:hypothetical protein
MPAITTVCPKCGLRCQGPRVRPHNCAARQAHPERYGPQPLPRPAAPSGNQHSATTTPSGAAPAPGKLSKGVRTLTLGALDVMPALPAPTNDEWANARRFAQMAESGTQVVVVAQIMCGFELIELQKRHGLGRGGDRKSKPNASVLKWEDVVKQQIGRSDDTARNWMNMAKAVAPRLKKLDGPWEAPALLALPPSEWPEGAREAVAKTLKNVCDGETQAEWMEELGLIGKAKERGGARTKTKEEKLTPAQEMEAFLNACREDFTATFSRLDALLVNGHWQAPTIADAELESAALAAEQFAAQAKAWLKTPQKKRTRLELPEATEAAE